MSSKLCEKYAPRSLSEIVGQPCVRQLRAFVTEPYPTAFLLESEHGGTGKTATAYALAHDLGLDESDTDLHFVNGTDVNIEWVREHFERIFKYRPYKGWHVCIIDELEWLNPTVQAKLKTAMDPGRMPKRLIVVATSNGAAKLSKPLLQRFTMFAYSQGEYFAEAAQTRLREIWQAECGDAPLPVGWESWGFDRNGNFSMRTALDRMQGALLLQPACVA